jgi:hypothetical protein
MKRIAATPAEKNSFKDCAVATERDEEVPRSVNRAR